MRRCFICSENPVEDRDCLLCRECMGKVRDGMNLTTAACYAILCLDAVALDGERRHGELLKRLVNSGYGYFSSSIAASIYTNEWPDWAPSKEEFDVNLMKSLIPEILL